MVWYIGHTVNISHEKYYVVPVKDGGKFCTSLTYKVKKVYIYVCVCVCVQTTWLFKMKEEIHVT